MNWDDVQEVSTVDYKACENALKGGFTHVEHDGVVYALKQDDYGYVEWDEQ